MTAEKEQKMLAELYPELGAMAQKLLNAARTAGLRVMLFSGYRSFEQQQSIFNKRDGATNARGGFSWHNYGLAVDIVFMDDRGNPSWGAKHPWRKLGEIGESIGLEWGGRWKTIVDLAHFQWPTKHGLRLADMCRAHRAGGVPAAWKLLRETEGKKHGSSNSESVSRVADNGVGGNVVVGDGDSRSRRRDKRRLRLEQGELA